MYSKRLAKTKLHKIEWDLRKFMVPPFEIIVVPLKFIKYKMTSLSETKFKNHSNLPPRHR